MTKRPESLPEFESPPLVEVVLGVQFESIALRTVDVGPLWSIFREEFPRVEEHPPLEPVFEMFGSQRQSRGNARLEILQSAPQPRLWFIEAGGNQLVQFQSDRFLHNWRKQGSSGSEDYPRYEKIRQRFTDELYKVSQFFDQNSLGKIKPNQCEITYVNHVLSEEGEELWANPEIALRFLSRVDMPNELPSLEASLCQLRFALLSDAANPIGRLHINAKADAKVKERQRISIELTARGSPLQPTIKSAVEFLNQGREAIVRGFAAVTTERMHKRWGRIR